jgi:hypothetical protein
MERAAVVVEARRRAAEQHRDPALQVQSLEVIDAERGRVHGLADEHGRRLHRGLPRVEIGPRQELIAEAQRDAAAIAVDGERRALAHARGLEQRHALEERAAVAGRLQADRGESPGNVVGCHRIPARAGFAAFHRIVGKLAHVGLDPPGGRIVGPRRGRGVFRRRGAGGRRRCFAIACGQAQPGEEDGGRGAAHRGGSGLESRDASTARWPQPRPRMPPQGRPMAATSCACPHAVRREGCRTFAALGRSCAMQRPRLRLCSLASRPPDPS